MTSSNGLIFMNNSGAIDSNIFIYALNEQADQHNSAKKFLRQQSKFHFFVTPQNILEIFNVVTDSKKFPSPLTPKNAQSSVKSIVDQDSCSLVFPSDNTWEITLKLALKYNIMGKQKIYDCYLAATLLENNIEILYTANTEDFAAFPFLRTQNPL